MSTEETKPSEPSKLDLVKSKFKKAKDVADVMFEDPLVTLCLGTGAGVIAGVVLTAAYPNFFLKPGAFYNPAQPIPTLGLSEDEIKQELTSGIMVGAFLKEKDLLKEVVAFSGGWRLKVIAAFKQAPVLTEPDPAYELLSRIKVEL